MQQAAVVLHVLFTFSLGLASWTATCSAQAKPSETEVASTIQNWLNSGCIRLPLGEHQIAVHEVADYESPKAALVRSFGALERSGIVTVQRFGGGFHGTRFRVGLNNDVDKGNFRIGASSTCLISVDYAKVQTVIKVDALKGGRTQWDAAVAYLTYEYRETPLAKAYFKEAGIPLLGDNRKMRALFRYDPFRSKWLFKTVDFASVTSEFSTNFVTRALQSD